MAEEKKEEFTPKEKEEIDKSLEDAKEGKISPLIQEECDPMTMNCSEMPKAMETLTKKSEILRSGLQTMEEIQDVMPSQELDNLYKKTNEEKTKVDGKIKDIVLRFSKCRLYEPEEETSSES